MRIALAAILFGLAGARSLANDLCADATAITGEGVFAFDNGSATMDGPSHAECIGSGSGTGDIAHDLWYCWTSPCDGVVTIDTCRQTTVDTTLAVYDGCDCPTDGATLLACNSEPPLAENEFCAYQSRVTFTAVAGQSYLVRLGTEPQLGGGAGTFTIACGAPTGPACALAEHSCQPRDHWTAFPSDGTAWIVADDFSPTATGTVTQLCWWGGYASDTGDCSPPGDAFEVTYYEDNGGVPGAVLAGPFRQADGTLTVDEPVRTYGRLLDAFQEYEYHAVHDPVPVLAGMCCWVQIVNVTGGACLWHWEASDRSIRALSIRDGSNSSGPDGFSFEDLVEGNMAFCLDATLGPVAGCVLPPVNDACNDALLIDEGLTLVNTTNAMTDPHEQPYGAGCSGFPVECCTVLGDWEIHRDIWFTYSPPCIGLLRIDMCDSLFDAKVGVYEHDPCSGYDNWLACSDDACGDGLMRQPYVDLMVFPGRDYTIQIGGYQSYEDDERTSRSDCFVAHPPEAGGGCDDPVCQAAVCSPEYPGDPSCCESAWDDWCATLALMMCSGHSGPGSLYLDLVALPPDRMTLRDYTDFLACFSGPCSTGSCDPPIYPEPCCLASDYDNDGDVDTADFAIFRSALTGPSGQP